jgi:hypothetical protein
MLLQDLPEEILSHILDFALDESASPCGLLCASRTVYRLAYPYLYNDLWFTSTQQLRLFAEGARIPQQFTPRFVTVMLPGGEDFRDFAAMSRMLATCAPSGRLELDTLRLCLNTLSTDPNLHNIEVALAITK